MRPGGGSGINCDGVQGSVIVNNVLYDNRASGISLYRIDGLLPASGNVLANNTVLMPADGRWALNVQNGSGGNVVFNNILLNAHSFRGSIDISADSLPGFVSDHNVLTDRINAGGTTVTLAGWRGLTGNDGVSIALNAAAWPALFVDLAGRDLRLSAGSAARDAGTHALAGRGAPRRDAEGEFRPLGPAYDVGAYEHDAECAVDWDRSGTVTSTDLSAFITTWLLGVADGSGRGDFNRDGRTDSGDISAFITAWLAGC